MMLEDTDELNTWWLLEGPNKYEVKLIEGSEGQKHRVTITHGSQQIYSTEFWSVSPSSTVNMIITTFASEVRNSLYPIELAYTFGGLLYGEPPQFFNDERTEGKGNGS